MVVDVEDLVEEMVDEMVEDMVEDMVEEIVEEIGEEMVKEMMEEMREGEIEDMVRGVSGQSPLLCNPGLFNPQDDYYHKLRHFRCSIYRTSKALGSMGLSLS